MPWGTYPSRVTAARTFANVAGATTSGRLSAFDTVAVDTPARRATSAMRTGRDTANWRGRRRGGRSAPGGELAGLDELFEHQLDQLFL